MLFAATELAGLEAVSKLPGFEEATADTAAAVLEECAKFNEGVVARAGRLAALTLEAKPRRRVRSRHGRMQRRRRHWQRRCVAKSTAYVPS